jgi:hypothetical protein
MFVTQGLIQECLMKNSVGILTVLLIFAVSGDLFAQSPKEWDNPQQSNQPENTGVSQLPQQTGAATDQPVPSEATRGEESAVESDGSRNLHEDPSTQYHLVGMRFRWIFVPKWFVTMFGVDAKARNMKRPMVSNLGVGAEYTYRKDNFDITTAIWYAQLDWEDPISFKESGEPPQSWEVVDNSLSALLFTGDFIWSSPIRDWVAITYGVGIGFGFAIGEINRTEAMVNPPSGETGLVKCDGPGGDSGCDAGGEYNETYDKIKVVPWINLLAGARFKPHEHIAIYVDGGFGLGFQMGVRGGYIF